MIYANVITLEKESKRVVEQAVSQDWQRVLNLTVEPKRVFISSMEPIEMVDALIEQVPHEKLKIMLDELIYRTKLFF
jgi:hypothetical protein